VIRYREIRPSERLRSFVSRFWILEHDGDDVTPQRIVPDGRCEMVLNWGRPFEAQHDGEWRTQPASFLAGQLDGPLLLRPRGPSRMLGIGFHPHGVARLMAHPMHELSGRFTPVVDLSRSLSRELQDALEQGEPIAAVERALLAAVKPGDRLIDESVRRIVISKGAIDLAALARDLGLSIRQLERRFQTAVGLPPKFFCRIERFNRVYRAIGEGAANWAEIAVDCGYYDQAHLIRDCKSLSGTTPAVLAADNADLARYFYQRFGLSHLSNPHRRVSL
jgi:AraC-like DNA-binding protein